MAKGFLTLATATILNLPEPSTGTYVEVGVATAST